MDHSLIPYVNSTSKTGSLRDFRVVNLDFPSAEI